MSIELSSNDGTKMAAFFTAFSKAQAEINNVLADTKGHNYQYAELSQVLAVIRKPFADNGLAIMQLPNSIRNEDGTTSTYLATIITHESGEWIKSNLSIDYQGGAKTSAIQQLGSHITYARRYMASAMTGVAQVDDESELLPTEAAPANKKADKKKTAPMIEHINTLLSAKEVNEYWKSVKADLNEEEIALIHNACGQRINAIKQSQEAFNNA